MGFELTIGEVARQAGVNIQKEFDLIVLGGGSAAFAAAIKAAGLGAKVALAEEGVIGGTCLNRGCIPSKSLLRAAEIYHISQAQPFSGIEIPRGKLDLAALMAHKDALLQELRQEKYWDVLVQYPGITYLPHQVQFLSPHEVRIGDEVYTAPAFVIATGATPEPLSVRGVENVSYLTSQSALELKELPRSMIILGGRFVALEIGQLYSRFGTRVTLLQRSDRIIPDEEEEIALALRHYLEEDGMDIHTGVRVTEVGQDGDEKRVGVSILGREAEFRGEALLMATGIRPNTGDLGLERAGVRISEKGAVKVNDEMQTSVPHIWAAGDVVGKMQLVTTAAHEGAVAAENALTGKGKKVDYTAVPHAIFTQPGVGSAGLTEREALERGLRIETRVLDLEYVPKARAIRDTRGLIKMVAVAGSRRIIGVHMLGPEAPEVIHLAALMIQHGMTVEDAGNKIDVYPTMSEAVKLVAQSFTKDVGKLSCCAE